MPAIEFFPAAAGLRNAIGQSLAGAFHGMGLGPMACLLFAALGQNRGCCRDVRVDLCELAGFFFEPLRVGGEQRGKFGRIRWRIEFGVGIRERHYPAIEGSNGVRKCSAARPTASS